MGRGWGSESPPETVVGAPLGRVRGWRQGDGSAEGRGDLEQSHGLMAGASAGGQRW